MNRLILIGNGFDRAHGMKTSYNDFILWYLKKCFTKAFEKGFHNDDLIQISIKSNNSVYPFNHVSDFIDYFYKVAFKDVEREKFEMPERNSNIFQNPFNIKFKSDLLRRLLTNCSNSKWVDIENEFYYILKSLLSSINDDYQQEHLKLLNKSLKNIIDELEIYLSNIKPNQFIDPYKIIFKSVIKKDDIVIENNLEEDEEAKETLILNFNYTSTPEKYFEKDLRNFNLNYIHGKINDPKNKLIFGFGDELDSDYSKMELQKANAFFTYIKSFWYFKTSNYHELVRFIEINEFQVYIIGHSCGLSDRTMLNMIFEHKNCKSIKIFYHGNKEQNNFTNLTQEISRHFKDKLVMRKKIVPFDKSESMPQVE